MERLGVFILFAAALPAALIAGFVVSNWFLGPGFEPVDLSDPPVDLAVIAAWSGNDGRVRCRAFYRSDLLQHPDSLPVLRYRLSASDMAICQASIDQFRRDREWPEPFSWSRRALGVAASQPDPNNPNLFEVAYPPDEDRIAVTRYEVERSSGQPVAFRFRGAFGPARGLAVLIFGGLAGAVLWLGLLAWYNAAFSAARTVARSGKAR